MNSWTEVLTNIKQAIINKDAKAYAEAVENALDNDLPERNCGDYSIGYDGCEVRIDYKNYTILFKVDGILVYELLKSSLGGKEEIYRWVDLPVFRGTAIVYTNNEQTGERSAIEILSFVTSILNQVLEACKD